MDIQKIPIILNINETLGPSKVQVQYDFDCSDERIIPSKIVMSIGPKVSKLSISNLIDHFNKVVCGLVSSSVSGSVSRSDEQLSVQTGRLDKYVENTRERIAHVAHPDMHSTTLQGRTKAANFIRSINARMDFTEEDIMYIISKLDRT